MFKIITLDLTRIGRMQLSCKSIKLGVICSKSSLKSNLKTRDQFHKTVKQELRLKFFLKWKVYSYSVSQNLKLKSKIFHETGSRILAWSHIYYEHWTWNKSYRHYWLICTTDVVSYQHQCALWLVLSINSLRRLTERTRHPHHSVNWA